MNIMMMNCKNKQVRQQLLDDCKAVGATGLADTVMMEIGQLEELVKMQLDRKHPSIDIEHPLASNGNPMQPLLDMGYRMLAEYSRYGCHDHPPFGDVVKLKTIEFPFTMSRDCKYDRPHLDSKCTDCIHAKKTGGSYGNA